MKRALVVALLVVVGGTVLGSAQAASAAPGRPVEASGPEAELFAMVNAERAANGIAPLMWRDDVAAIAEDWSGQMAASGTLSHNDAYFSDATRNQLNSAARAENVAYNFSVPGAHAAFMNSPSHRANILDPNMTQGGFGIVIDGNGDYWVTEDFMRPRAGAAPALPPPAPEPEPAPAPEPVAAPEPAPAPAPVPPTTAPPVTEPPTTVPPTTVAPVVPETVPSTTATPELVELASPADGGPVGPAPTRPVAPAAMATGLAAIAFGSHLRHHRHVLAQQDRDLKRGR